jgi:hypothetical protein
MNPIKHFTHYIKILYEKISINIITVPKQCRTVEPAYNDIGLCDISSIALDNL